jgi:molybdate transport system substrate-binding protein
MLDDSRFTVASMTSQASARPIRSLRLLLLVLCTTALTGAAELNVFAAASLSDSLKELAPRFQAATGHTLRFNFGASGALARQIKEGAPADVILSADELRVDQLEKAGLLLPGTRQTILANTLVVVVAAEEGAPVKALTDLAKADVRRLAIGEPATVPVGTYTKEHLQQLGLWEALLVKMVPLDNVRAVLAAVESGNADAGFVYRTDALISKKVRIVVEVPRAAGPKITYPVAVLKDTKQPDAARTFACYLAGVDAQKVFAKFGFLPPN